jgi:hypothetical protein
MAVPARLKEQANGLQSLYYRLAARHTPMTSTNTQPMF